MISQWRYWSFIVYVFCRVIFIVQIFVEHVWEPCTDNAVVFTMDKSPCFQSFHGPTFPWDGRSNRWILVLMLQRYKESCGLGKDREKGTSHFYSFFLCASFVLNQEDNWWESLKNFKCKLMYENPCHNHRTRKDQYLGEQLVAATPQGRAIPR